MDPFSHSVWQVLVYWFVFVDVRLDLKTGENVHDGVQTPSFQTKMLEMMKCLTSSFRLGLLFLTKMFGKKRKCLTSSFWLGLTMVASAGEEDNTIFFSSLFFSCKKQNSNTEVRSTKIQAITKVFFNVFHPEWTKSFWFPVSCTIHIPSAHIKQLHQWNF